MTTYDIIDILKFVLRDISIISDIMFWFYHTLPFQGVPPENYRPWWSLEKSPSSPSQPTHVFPIKTTCFSIEIPCFSHKKTMFFHVFPIKIPSAKRLWSGSRSMEPFLAEAHTGHRRLGILVCRAVKAGEEKLVGGFMVNSHWKYMVINIINPLGYHYTVN